MTDNLLGLVLTRIDQVAAPLLLHRDVAGYPAADLEDLLSTGIIRKTSRAVQVPRPAHMPAGGDLLVRETARGLFGVADEDDYHQPVLLNEEDVRQYEIVVSRLLDRIRRENEIKGTSVENGRHLFLIGERAIPGRQRADVYVSLLNDDESTFMLVCKKVQPADSRPVVMLVPGSIPLSIENRELVRTWDVFLIPLSTHLDGKRWRLPWDQVAKKPGRQGKHATPEDSYCRVITHEGTNRRAKREYEKLVKGRSRYDLFIDAITREASCRHGKGKPRVSKLTANELGILTDYIESQKPMRPSGTRTGGDCLSAASACKLFETARGKVDAKLGRYEYRAFRLHKNPSDPRLKSYEFAPPEDLAYCLILPA